MLLATVAVALVALAMVPVAGLAATGDAGFAQTTNESNETADAAVAPGERLNGVLGVQDAEIGAEVDSRAFGLEVARAASNGSRADVVADRLAAVEEQVAELEQRKERLDQARENGSLGEGAYRAEVAKVAAELEGAERLANQSANATERLPVELLEEKGIDAGAIQMLQDRANELGGQEVAEIARSIAGPDVGKAPGHAGPPDGERGPPEETDRGDGRPETPAEDGDDRPGEAGNETADAPADDGGADGSDRGDADTETPTRSDDRGDGTDAASERGR